MRKIKRFTVGLLLAVTACLMAVGFTGCTQKGDREKQEIHVCTWEVQSETQASCTSNAKVKMICKDASCGKTQTTVLPGTMLEHQYEDESLLTVPATCTTNAKVKAHSCVMCGDAKIGEREIPNTKTYHDGDLNKDGKLDANDLVVVDEKTREMGFDFDNPKSREPNCQEQAYCGDCGMFWGDKLNHNISLVVYEEVKPTCTQDGHVEYVACTATSELTGEQCTYSTYKLLHKLGHDGEIGTVATDEYDETYYKYTHNSKTLKAENFKNVDSKLPTCTSAAYCGICQAYWDEETYGHDMDSPTCEEAAKCKKCDFTQGVALGHIWQQRAGQVATCEEEGWGEYLYCERCPLHTKETVPAKGHIWAEISAVEPTCTEVGYTKGEHCTRCREIKIAPVVIEALGHDGQRTDPGIGIFESTKSNLPDCTRKGYCGICKSVYGSTSETGKHDTVKIPAQEPTCEKEGWFEYAQCKYCSYSTYEQNVRQPLQHNTVVFEYKAPTCTEDGHKAQTICVNCEKLQTIPATGHDVECKVEGSIKGNCLAQGYCAVCQEHYGNPSGAHEVGTPATCTDKAVCRVCQEEYGEPLEHYIPSNWDTCVRCGKDETECTD